MAQIITDQNFQSEVLESPVPVVVDFFAEWCGPCRAMSPIVDELSTEYGGKVKFVKMDVDANSQIPGTFQVMSIPTFIMFKDGKPATGFRGAAPKEEFKKVVDTLLA